MTIKHPDNAFWSEVKLPKELMDHTWSMIEIAKIDRRNAKTKLAGHNTASYDLPDDEGLLCKYFLEASKELTFAWNPDLAVRELWVNFQKKGEFNPIHRHAGVMSFVLWVQIPYEYKDECELETARNISIKPCGGSFQFVTTSIEGHVGFYDYNLDPTYNGTAVIFPAGLNHQVYPFFTSDEDRISIAGNIY